MVVLMQYPYEFKKSCIETFLKKIQKQYYTKLKYRVVKFKTALVIPTTKLLTEISTRNNTLIFKLY